MITHVLDLFNIRLSLLDILMQRQLTQSSARILEGGNYFGNENPSIRNGTAKRYEPGLGSNAGAQRA